MRKVKVELVTGEVKTKDGQRRSDLPEKIQKALQAIYDSGAENIEVTPEVKWDTAATGGAALLIVVYDGKDDKKEKSK